MKVELTILNGIDILLLNFIFFSSTRSYNVVDSKEEKNNYKILK